MDASFQSIPMSQLKESPLNARKAFDKAQLDELTSSVREKGILNPLLVRPNGGKVFEILAGARRFRAAKAAGLEEAPAIVRELDDKAAMELMLVDNLQRSDLHPLEEAEGYEQLQKLHGYSVEDLAAKVGKSKGYVYARMKLTALTPEGRKAFHAAKLTPSTALLVARIPVAELQNEALREITKAAYHGGPVGELSPMSYRQAFDFIQRTFMLRLSEAPFRADDAELVPTAGPCTTCPKRTGNQRELFGDVKSGDVCTDPKCFDSKRQAVWARTKAEALAQGAKVLEDGAAKKLFPYGERLGDRAPYVDLGAENYEDPKSRRWGQLLGKGADEHVVLARDGGGGLHRLVPRDRVPELLKAAGHKPAERVSASNRESQRLAQRAKAERAKTLLENKVRAQAVAAIRTKVVAPLRADDLRLVALMFFNEMHHESRKQLLGCLDTDFERGKYGYELSSRFKKLVASMDAAALAALLVVMTISPRDYWQDHKDPIGDVAKRYKVDLTRIRKEVLAAAAKTKAPAAKKAAKNKR